MSARKTKLIAERQHLDKVIARCSYVIEGLTDEALKSDVRMPEHFFSRTAKIVKDALEFTPVRKKLRSYMVENIISYRPAYEELLKAEIALMLEQLQVMRMIQELFYNTPNEGEEDSRSFYTLKIRRKRDKEAGDAETIELIKDGTQMSDGEAYAFLRAQAAMMLPVSNDAKAVLDSIDMLTTELPISDKAAPILKSLAAFWFTKTTNLPIKLPNWQMYVDGVAISEEVARQVLEENKIDPRLPPELVSNLNETQAKVDELSASLEEMDSGDEDRKGEMAAILSVCYTWFYRKPKYDMFFGTVRCDINWTDHDREKVTKQLVFIGAEPIRLAVMRLREILYDYRGELESRVSKRPVRNDTVSLKARALALVLEHPGWTDREIAKHVPCHPKTLYKWPEFQIARRTLKETGKARLPRGSKYRGEKLEAWNNSSEEDTPNG